MRSSRVLFALVLAALVWYWRRSPAPPASPEDPPVIRRTPSPARPSEPSIQPSRAAAPVPVVPSAPPAVVIAPPAAGGRPPAKRAPRAHYVVDDGIAVVQGDVAVGRLNDPNAPPTGQVELSPMRPWPKGEIAYAIQPDVVNPERVRQALRLFDGTPIRFVEWSNQTDVLVFEATTGICKSYLGMIGGKQPLWVAPDCGPPEIAHEILHALGFAHEQNRADRDDHVVVHLENIEEQYLYNFDKLPEAYTRLNQRGPFDFTSLMMYPPWMFAKGGQSTMSPRDSDQRIQPGTTLSDGDRRRLEAP